MRTEENTGRALSALVCVAAFLLVAATTGAARAQDVDIRGAWVRTAVPGQKATGAFMVLTAKNASRLVSVASPVADVVELHEMRMDGDVMRMRSITDGLDLPAGKAVVLKPGGRHAMLMDLKTGLPKDSTIPLILTFRRPNGKESVVTLQAPVTTAPPEDHGVAPVFHHSHAMR
jgi:periplasmic copper chaperone A